MDGVLGSRYELATQFLKLVGSVLEGVYYSERVILILC